MKKKKIYSSDDEGNYDLDGVSSDGEEVYLGSDAETTEGKKIEPTPPSHSHKKTSNDQKHESSAGS